MCLFVGNGKGFYPRRMVEKLNILPMHLLNVLCLIISGHFLSPHILGLYELWKTGRYKSYPPDVLIDLVARILALVPPWTRIYRVQRY